MDLLDIIWSGVSLPDQSHFDQIQKSFLDKLPLDINNLIEKCSTELELISLLKPFFQWISIPQHLLLRFNKSEELSKILRERANESYKTGNLCKAERGYNLAIAFAPLKSTELGLGFGNRSALFVQIKKYSLAIKDIQLALANNFPQDLQKKLIERKEKCLLALKNQEKAKIKNSTEMEEVKSFCTRNFFQLQNPGEKIPNAEDWLEIDANEEKGRRLVATKKIPAGTLILIDKPFVSVINNLLQWDLTRCHFCSKSLQDEAALPCQLCTFTMYCNEDCRQKSSHTNHKYEHNYLPYLQSFSQLTISHRDLQALRLIATVGPKELYKLYQNLHILSSTQNQISGQNCNGIYDSNSYLPMYHLISHGLQKSAGEKIFDVFKSMFFCALLKQTSSSFFEEIPKKKLISYENFMSSLILHHIWNIRYNAISISELKSSATGEEISVSFAAAVYPLISLCNHSCDPNAAPVKRFKFLETSLVTLKNLNRGDEIFITYKPLFTQTKTKERLEFLKESYNFVCKCEACLNNWGPKSVRNFNVELEIPTCNDCQKIQKPCEVCVRSHLKTIASLEGFEAQLYEADRLIKEGEYLKATQILKPCLVYFSQYFSPCYLLSQVALDLFKRALVRLVYQTQIC